MNRELCYLDYNTYLCDMNSLFRNSLHTFRRFWRASLLNFIGLVIAFFAFFIFITSWKQQAEYNTCFDDYKRMYRVEVEGCMFGPDSMWLAVITCSMENLARSVPGVEDACVLLQANSPLYFQRDGGKLCVLDYVGGYGKTLNFWRKGIAPDSLTSDYPLNADGKRDGVLIPKSFAMDYFHTSDVVGKHLKWEVEGRVYDYKIVSVYDDFPQNCSVGNFIYNYEEDRDSLNFQNYNSQIFVKTDASQSLSAIEEHITEKFINSLAVEYELEADSIKVNMSPRVHLRPVSETYFSDVDDVIDKGNNVMLAIFLLSAIFVLVLTNVNYMNFSLSEAPFRIKNINTRRVYGASCSALTLELIVENVMMCVIAYIVSMIALYVVDGFVDDDISPLSNVVVSILTFVSAVIVGVLSGVYPAYFITSTALSMSVKGMKTLPKKKRMLSDIRLAFQLFICLLTVINSFVLIVQAYYIFHSDYGYCKDRVVYGVVNSVSALLQKDSFKEKLLAIDGVESVSFSRFIIGAHDRYMMWSRPAYEGEENVFTNIMPVDKDYCKTLGIEIVKGRDFTPADTSGYIITEATLRKYPWVEVGKPLYDNDIAGDNPVVAVCRNIRYCSIRRSVEEPLVFVVGGSENEILKFSDIYNNILNIRIADDADVGEIYQKIEKCYNEIAPDDKLKLEMLDDALSELYDNEFLFMVHTFLFALLYIVITLIGLSCTIMFENEYNRKEIGIRMAFGASKWSLVFHKMKFYLLILAVAFVLAVPVSYFMCQYMLEAFVVKSPYLWIAFPTALLFVSVLMIAIIVVRRYEYLREKVKDMICTE